MFKHDSLANPLYSPDLAQCNFFFVPGNEEVKEKTRKLGITTDKFKNVLNNGINISQMYYL